MGVDYRLLGPLSVVRDGVPVELGAHRQRALLGLLLANAGTVLSTDRILDELWGVDFEPESLVWCEGMADWQRADTIPDLRVILAGRVPSEPKSEPDASPEPEPEVEDARVLIRCEADGGKAGLVKERPELVAGTGVVLRGSTPAARNPSSRANM